MRLALTTLGTPDWDLDTVLDRAADYGFDGVDFRGLGDELDVTLTPEFTDQVGETRRKLDARGLRVSAISSGLFVCRADRREENLAEAERTVRAARALDAPYVRVFGHGDPDEHSMADLAAVGGETLADVLAIDGADDVTWLVETHDAWTASEDVELLLDRAPDDVGVLWDVAHTVRHADETPAETLDALGDEVAYVHLKDAAYDPSHPDAMDDGWRYVLPGEGDLPLADAVAELRDRGYDGWVTYEHETRWHPEIPPPEAANPAFVDWFRSL